MTCENYCCGEVTAEMEAAALRYLEIADPEEGKDLEDRLRNTFKATFFAGARWQAAQSAMETTKKCSCKKIHAKPFGVSTKLDHLG